MKDGNNLIHSKLIDRLNILRTSSSSISCGSSQLIKLNKKANIVKRMTSDYKF